MISRKSSCSTRHIANEYQRTPHWDVIDGITDVMLSGQLHRLTPITGYFSNVEYDALNRVLIHDTGGCYDRFKANLLGI